MTEREESRFRLTDTWCVLLDALWEVDQVQEARRGPPAGWAGLTHRGYDDVDRLYIDYETKGGE